MRACQGLHGIIIAFGHTLWSWIADQKMVALMLMAKMNEEVPLCEGRVGSSSGSRRGARLLLLHLHRDNLTSLNPNINRHRLPEGGAIYDRATRPCAGGHAGHLQRIVQRALAGICHH